MKGTISRLLQYIETLSEWNEKYNLVSCKTIRELLINHIIDSLSIIELLDFKNLKIVDVGTGPGLPGIILSILSPSNRYLLVEPKKKYYRFLKKVVMKLKLGNIDLLNNKIEQIANDLNSCDIILSRAVGKLDFFCRLKNIDKTSLLIFYKGVRVLEELSSVNLEGFKIMFIKKIKLLEKYYKSHYIIALRKKD